MVVAVVCLADRDDDVGNAPDAQFPRLRRRALETRQPALTGARPQRSQVGALERRIGGEAAECGHCARCRRGTLRRQRGGSGQRRGGRPGRGFATPVLRRRQRPAECGGDLGIRLDPDVRARTVGIDHESQLLATADLADQRDLEILGRRAVAEIAVRAHGVATGHALVALFDGERTGLHLQPRRARPAAVDGVAAGVALERVRIDRLCRRGEAGGHRQRGRDDMAKEGRCRHVASPRQRKASASVVQDGLAARKP